MIKIRRTKRTFSPEVKSQITTLGACRVSVKKCAALASRFLRVSRGSGSGRPFYPQGGDPAAAPLQAFAFKQVDQRHATDDQQNSTK